MSALMMAEAMTRADQQENHRSFLLDQIARERREVRILESERALLLSKNRSNSNKNGRKRYRSDANVHGSRGLDSDDINSLERHSAAFSGPIVDISDDVSNGNDANRKSAADSSNNTADERDLLDVLDALQCRTSLEAMVDSSREQDDSSSTNINNDTTFDKSGLAGFDAESFRLHPLLGGIAFTKVEGPLPPSSSSSTAAAVPELKRQLYVLSGHVVVHSDTATTITDGIGFEVRAEVSFTPGNSSNMSSPRKTGHAERAAVSSVRIKFSPHKLSENCSAEEEKSDDTFSMPFPTEELLELGQLVKKTRSLTQLFRELVAFQDFHFQRAESIKKLIAEFGSNAIRIASSDIYSIRSRVGSENCGLDMKLSWARTFSELGREDELSVEHAGKIPGDARGDEEDEEVRAAMDTLMDPDGISALVDCVGGCEGAIRVILKAIHA